MESSGHSFKSQWQREKVALFLSALNQLRRYSVKEQIFNRKIQTRTGLEREMKSVMRVLGSSVPPQPLHRPGATVPICSPSRH